jgi:alkaline phosphatase D
MALAAPHARSLWQATAVDYVWDDHDFGPNDSDGSSPSRLAAISSYAQAVPTLSSFPSSACSPHTGEIFHAFAWGRYRPQPQLQLQPQLQPQRAVVTLT